MTPDERRERLKQSAELVAQVWFGLGAYLERAHELIGGYPREVGGGVGGGGSVSDRTGNAAVNGHSDPGAEWLDEFDAEVNRLYRSALALNDRYQRAFDMRPPATLGKVEDPGCELCTTIPVMEINGKGQVVQAKPLAYEVVTPFPRTHCHVKVEQVRRGGSTTVNTVRVCHWCYNFWLRVKRLPTREECRAHAEGRPVKVSA